MRVCEGDVLAELGISSSVELPTSETKVELPPWLRDVLDREVTDEPEYSYARLARSPVVPATTKEAGDDAQPLGLE
jgi:CYTH domain-containing protein